MVLVGIFLMPFGNSLQKNIASAEDPTTYYVLEYKGLAGNTLANYENEDKCKTARNVATTLGYTIVQDCIKSVGKGEKLSAQQDKDVDSVEFGCRWWKPISLNCLVAGLYYLIFQPLAWISAGAAAILDYFVYYSISDEAYRNSFVGKGWGVIRDIANIFFIIGLLFIAIKTILGINTTNNKKMLVGIVLFALLINFSLFTTQVIIDASNILARIFYHQVDPVDGNGVKIGDGKDQRSVTVGLVRQFDPVDMVGKPPMQGDEETVDVSERQLLGKFLLMVILSIIMMVFMIYIFLSVSFLFVARVASLWILMIFSPLAFASHAISTKIKGFGWDEWLPNVLKNAFMAPIFVFFLYIIIQFGDLFENSVTAKGSDDTFILSALNVIIPFMLVFVLLKQAKTLAVEYSGEMGKTITAGAAAIGGLALGGAALGGAALGRSTIGAYMKGASTGDTAAQRFRDGTSRGFIDKFKGRITNGSNWENWQKKVGARVNKDQAKVEHSAHARFELDKTAGEKYHGKKYSDLTAPERAEVKDILSKNKIAQADYGKNFSSLNKFEKKKVVDKLKINSMMPGYVDHGTMLEREARKKQGVISNLVQSSRTGSMDLRNLSKVTANEGDTGLSKLTSGITALTGTLMRGSLKKTVGFNYGEGQKSFFKDLGHTITEALKGASFKVDLTDVGKVEKEKHGGGGAHH